MDVCIYINVCEAFIPFSNLVPYYGKLNKPTKQSSSVCLLHAWWNLTHPTHSYIRILFWGIIMQLEPLTWEVCAICALVSGGVSMASYGEASFSWMGFALVTAACCLSGLRWGLTQIMLEEDDDDQEGGVHHQPLAILYHISLASALSCVPVFLMIELKPFTEYSPFFQDPGVFLEVSFVLLTGGLISFLLILAEVKLVQISSSLTMGLFGVCKEFVTVALSMAVFHDKVSLLNVLGLGFAVAGVVWYRKYKSVPRPSPHAPSRAPSCGGLSMVGVGGPGGTATNAPYTEVKSGMWHLDEDDEEGGGGVDDCGSPALSRRNNATLT